MRIYYRFLKKKHLCYNKRNSPLRPHPSGIILGDVSCFDRKQLQYGRRSSSSSRLFGPLSHTYMTHKYIDMHKNKSLRHVVACVIVTSSRQRNNQSERDAPWITVVPVGLKDGRKWSLSVSLMRVWVPCVLMWRVWGVTVSKIGN